ncbi:kelch domain-containing protein 3 [Borealophlyctis nickersoniae]|nr:kelch domain-containing protein 3 [Borealophlyctis nickersoniae]
MDYGTGKTADYTVTPLNDAFNTLNTFGSACAYDASSKLIHCWGGQEVSTGKLYNILSSFDTTAMKWVRVAAYPEVPGHMQSASAVVGSSLYMYGDYGSATNRTSDFYRIDLKTYALSRVTATGVSGIRTFHCMATLSDTKLIMHGGATTSDSTYTNQVLIFDTQTNSWTDVTPSNATTAPPSPSGRRSHGCAVGQNGGFYIFGGLDSLNSQDFLSSNDLWVLESPQRQWKRLTANKANNIPNVPDTRFDTCLVSLGRFLITYGGGNAEIRSNSISVAYDPNLYFFDTDKSEWISSIYYA